jgi:cytochrome c553
MAAGAMLLAAAPAARPDLDWLYPARTGPLSPLANPDALVSLPGVPVKVTKQQLRDYNAAVDWYPGRHGTPPAIVLMARPPDGFACGFCHLVGGGGRPENASLAGLPEAYIIAQTRAFRDGTRTSIRPGWRPTALMTAAAAHTSEADVAAAAKWFSGQAFVSRVKVVETDTVPATAPLGSILAAIDGPRQTIAGRIIEVPDDPERFELRDPDSRFTAFVPTGSIARGAAVAERLGCLECHSSMLGGWGPGRSPSYIVRQLLAFKTGVRNDASAQPMQEVTAQLSEAEMIDVAAWFANLPVSP